MSFNPNTTLKILYQLTIAVLISFAILPSLKAQTKENQWQMLTTFNAPVHTVYFLDIPGPPRIGFVGTVTGLYKTTDGGITWKRPVVDDPKIQPSDFTFKDSLNGWFSNRYDQVGSAQCYRTTDGGDTWRAIYGPTIIGTGIFYDRYSKVLMLTAWSPQNSRTSNAKSCISTDEGKTWTVFYQGPEMNGFAFIDSLTGIVTGKGGGYLRTTDGGLSWNFVDVTGDEAWQPLGDSSKRMFWTAAEKVHPFISYDQGRKFQQLVAGPFLSTGTMREGTCGRLYIQYRVDGGYLPRGVMYSDDSGYNWRSVVDAFGRTGPVNELDTRFYVQGSYIFAGGIDTLTGRQYSLWRYVGDSTRFSNGSYGAPFASSHNIHMISTSCGQVDTSLKIVFHYDCATADLIEAKILPANRFTLALPDPLPYRIQADYTIPLVYSPIGHDPDSASIALTYLVNGKTLYDTVRVTAVAPGNRQFARFDILADNAKVTNVHSGSSTIVTVRLLDSVPDSIGLNTLSFKIRYDLNVLGFTDTFTVYPPWSIFQTSHLDGVETLVLRRAKGSDLLANSDIASYKFMGFVSHNSSTKVTLDSLRLNDDDSLFSLCYATAASTQPAIVNVGPDCGDSTLRAFMNGVLPLEIVSMSTDEKEASLRVRVTATADGILDVYSVDGKLVSSKAVSLYEGITDVPFTLEGLSNGVYFLRLSSNGTQASARFVRRR